MSDGRPTLPYDYARCMTKDCPLEATCMRKTPGRETYQTMFGPAPSPTCKYYYSKHIHGYDVSKANPEGISLTVPDLTTLLDALEAANTRTEDMTDERDWYMEEWVSAVDKMNRAVEAIEFWFHAEDYQMDESIRKLEAILAEIKGESHEYLHH